MNSSGRPSTQEENDEIHQEKQKFVEVAKKEVRDRRARRMQVKVTLRSCRFCWHVHGPKPYK